MSGRYLVIERIPNAASMDEAMFKIRDWYGTERTTLVGVYQLVRVVHVGPEYLIEEVSNGWTPPKPEENSSRSEDSQSSEAQPSPKPEPPDSSPTDSPSSTSSTDKCPNCKQFVCDCDPAEKAAAAADLTSLRDKKSRRGGKRRSGPPTSSAR